MITLHILKLLEINGIGTIDTDLFYQDAPIVNGKPKEGIWIVDRGAPVDRFSVKNQAYDLYARYTNKLLGAQKLQQVLDLLQTSYGDVCTLPTVPPYSTTIYDNVRIRPTSGVENVGFDANEKLVRVISGEVQW